MSTRTRLLSMLATCVLASVAHASPAPHKAPQADVATAQREVATAKEHLKAAKAHDRATKQASKRATKIAKLKATLAKLEHDPGLDVGCGVAPVHHSRIVETDPKEY